MERWLRQDSEQSPSVGNSNTSENLSLYKRFLDNLPVMIFVLDRNDRIIYFNNKFQQVLGYNAESLPASNLKKILSQKDWDTWNENLFKLSSLTDDDNCVFSVHFIDAVESEKLLRMQPKAFERDADGKPTLYLFTAEEDEGASLYNNILPNNCEDKNDASASFLEKQLQNKIDDLGRSNKELEQFAYLASHDLQEPLRKITVFTTRLQAKFEPILGDEGKKYIERINVAADGMRSLIDSLLQISRTIQHNQAPVKADLNDIVEKVIKNLDLKIEEGKVQIHHGIMPVIAGYPSLLIQLFENLVNNGIKFSSNNQVAIINIDAKELNEEEKKKLNLSATEKFFQIDIKDNGIGFKQEFATRIFNIFQRINSKAEFPGNGIGLAICKKIIEKHNGLIWAESELGKGAKFSIVLPKIHTTSNV